MKLLKTSLSFSKFLGELSIPPYEAQAKVLDGRKKMSDVKAPLTDSIGLSPKKYVVGLA